MPTMGLHLSALMCLMCCALCRHWVLLHSLSNTAPEGAHAPCTEIGSCFTNFKYCPHDAAFFPQVEALNEIPYRAISQVLQCMLYTRLNTQE